ncbi:larval/pupal rigid cuticle protein 66-like [Ostrinia furnacalis]|uniref:larval/pupal rigid cuticle protein 66-like n=1 Tax=Ostrinia furnacalis TaxID=93504 RepID=UPI00103EFA45|nr:larval/pupal rigid cuticle protein 66-like [Ostrinia furnacalis]
MVVKFVVILALAVAANASNFNSFAYDVADPFTGDFKSQAETRVGDRVRGQYSLLESDGTKRTVDYAAGAEGFNAQVRKDPAFIAAPAVYSAAPAVYSAAPAVYSAAPSVYSAAPAVYSAGFGYPALPYAKFAPYAYAKYF